MIDQLHSQHISVITSTVISGKQFIALALKWRVLTDNKSIVLSDYNREHWSLELLLLFDKIFSMVVL